MAYYALTKGMKKVKFMIFVAMISALANLFGCTFTPDVRDGDGMVYVDRDYRTQYANTLPFDDIDAFPKYAVAYLGKGDEGERNCEEYTRKLFCDLSKQERDSIGHYDFGGDEWYLVVPRHGTDNELVCADENAEPVINRSGIPFSMKCNGDVTVRITDYGGVEYTPRVDENGNLAPDEEIFDITHFVDLAQE